MIPLRLSEIADVVGGRLDGLQNGDDALVTGPAFLDTRTPEPARALRRVRGGAGRRARLRRGGGGGRRGGRPRLAPDRRAHGRRRRRAAGAAGTGPGRPRATPRDGRTPVGAGDHRLPGQDQRQGHAGAGAGRRRPDRGDPRLLQQRARAAAHRAPGRGVDPTPGPRDGRPRRRAPRRALRDRAARRVAGAQRRPRAPRRVRLAGADRRGQGRARRGAARRRGRGAQRGRPPACSRWRRAPGRASRTFGTGADADVRLGESTLDELGRPGFDLATRARPST